MPDLPDTPVGTRVRWYLGRLGDPTPLSDSELAANFEPSANVFAPPLQDERAWRGALSEGAIGVSGGAVTVRSDTELNIDGVTEEGRRWRYRFAVDPSTGRFSEFVIEWVQNEAVTVRLATEADARALADIERRSPMIMGDTRITIDRGDDYFAAARLMEDVAVAVAEVDGKPGAVQCAAAHTVHVGGAPYRMGYLHHLRILPEHQRKGLFQRLTPALSDYMPPHVDGTYAYVAPNNAASQRLLSFAKAWPAQPLMCELPLAGLGGPAAGRTATPDDAGAIVDILNACHRGEELYCPYSVDSLTDRLERAPDQYSWANLLVTDRAVVGVWPAGDFFQVIVDGPAGRHTEREGYVPDHGFLADAETDYEQLLRSWCSHLNDRGFTKLVTFTSRWSPNYLVLADLGGEMLPLDLFLFGPDQPEAADQRGVYVDAIYF